MTVTAPNTQTVGQPLTLTCNVTSVRGITSPAEIVWRRDGINLTSMMKVLPTDNETLVFSDSYTIPILSVNDHERDYQCELIISTSPSISINRTVTLIVAGR